MKELLIFVAITLLAGLGIWYFMKPTIPTEVSDTWIKLQIEKAKLE